jgi:hypothetical protein
MIRCAAYAARGGCAPADCTSVSAARLHEAATTTAAAKLRAIERDTAEK